MGSQQYYEVIYDDRGRQLQCFEGCVKSPKSCADDANNTYTAILPKRGGRSLVILLAVFGAVLGFAVMRHAFPVMAAPHRQSGAATVTLRPSPATIEGCETITVEIMINDVEALYAAEVRLSFDPDMLEVVDYNPSRFGVQLEHGDILQSGWFAYSEHADNTAGVIRYALTQLNPAQPVTGTGALAIIHMKAKAPGTSDIEFTYTKLADRDGYEILATSVDGTVDTTTGAGSMTLSIVRLNDTTARLSWTAVAGATGYRLYRDADPYFTRTDPPYIQTTGLSLDDAILADTNNYYYRVFALCGDDMASAASGRVGKFVITVLPGYNAVASPLIPSNPDINTFIGAQLTGGPNVTLGDRIFKWNASGQNYDAFAVFIDGTGNPAYDGKWLDELNIPNPSTMTFGLGAGFWIENRHVTQTLSLLGRVPSQAEQTYTFGGGTYSAFGIPYLRPLGVNDSDLYESGASGGPNVTLGDRIFCWNAATQNYSEFAVLIDGTGNLAYDGKWLDELNIPNPSPMVLAPGKSCFFEDRTPTGFVWTVTE